MRCSNLVTASCWNGAANEPGVLSASRGGFVFRCLRVCLQDAALEKDVDFWISLCCQFEVSDQLTSLINILNFLLQLPDDKDDGETQI